MSLSGRPPPPVWLLVSTANHRGTCDGGERKGGLRKQTDAGHHSHLTAVLPKCVCVSFQGTEILQQEQLREKETGGREKGGRHQGGKKREEGGVSHGGMVKERGVRGEVVESRGRLRGDTKTKQPVPLQGIDFFFFSFFFLTRLKI